MSKKIIGVLIDGKPTYHAPATGVADYNTLCCIDADDPSIGHEGLCDVPRGQKINCANCHTIWKETVAMRLRMSDFKVEE